MREEGDIIENFNKRIRNNKAAARRVHEMNKTRQKFNSTISIPAKI